MCKSKGSLDAMWCVLNRGLLTDSASLIDNRDSERRRNLFDPKSTKCSQQN